MPKVSSIKNFNIQSKKNGTCSLDDIIKENIKNSKPLSKIDLSKTNNINLLYDNTIFHDGRYSYDLDEVNYLSDVHETDILMKNEEKDNTIVDNQFYNISLRLSDVSIENIIISNQSIFKASGNIEEVKNDNFSNHKKYVPTDKKSGQIHLIKHEDRVIKKENIANKLSINNTINDDDNLIESSNKLSSKGYIPITLEYILQKNKIPLLELESIFQGKVLPCDLAAENNIKIVANGVLIAKGKIIWIENRLGVEITDLFHNEK
ncbi:MAG: FliM/FliN family flagellar motor switch protein [Candidatus Arsenophonus phytopathogenicus]